MTEEKVGGRASKHLVLLNAMLWIHPFRVVEMKKTLERRIISRVEIERSSFIRMRTKREATAWMPRFMYNESTSCVKSIELLGQASVAWNSKKMPGFLQLTLECTNV